MHKFMALALDEARTSLTEGGYPYGAVLVRGADIIGAGHNRERQTNDPTSHAEIEAIRAGGLQATYDDTVMYASAFPCLMCAGAIVRLGIPKVVVGAAATGYETSQQFMESHDVEVQILQLEAAQDLLTR